MSPFKRHFFVCINNRPPFAKPSCGARGSTQILGMLQEAAVARGLADVAVTATGCLGPCEHGPTVVVYPEGVWYTQVRPEDVGDIVEQHMVKGQPVERLRTTWPAMSD